MNLLEEIQKTPVEWKELGEVIVSLNTGLNPRSFFKLNTDGARNYYVTIREIKNGKLVITEKTDKIDDTARNLCNNRSNLEKGDILFSGTGTIGQMFVIEETPINWNIKEGVYAIKPRRDKINSRFLMYLLSSNEIKNSYLKMQAGGTVKSISMKMLKSLKIPIPPLEIQEKIVQILDKFTDYVTELTAELTLRQKQYSYFRDYLLNFDQDSSGGANNKVEWKTLGEIGTVSMCKRIMKEQTNSTGEIPFYKIGTFGKRPDSFISKELFMEYKEKYSYPKVGEVLISASGTIGRTVIFNGEPAYFQDSNIVWLSHNETIILNKYLFYIYQLQPWQVATGGTIKRLYNDNLKKTKIPVPPLEIQEKIVHVLDNFDTVCNDLNIGLPKEIELRQKQYEYFRDQLLTYAAEGVYTDSTVQYSTVQYRQDLIRLLWYVFGPIKVSLGVICDFTRGNGLQKKDFVEQGKPVIHYGQIYTKYSFSTKNTLSFTTQEVFDRLKKAEPNDIVMATTSENVEDVGKAVVWEGNEKIGVSGDAYIIHTSQNARFLNYYFKSNHFQIQKERKVTGTKVIRIHSKDMENFIITLPQLSEQECIVSILDKFDTLTSDLSQGLPKEIKLRQKEYEYFRDLMFQFQ